MFALYVCDMRRFCCEILRRLQCNEIEVCYFSVSMAYSLVLCSLSDFCHYQKRHRMGKGTVACDDDDDDDDGKDIYNFKIQLIA